MMAIMRKLINSNAYRFILWTFLFMMAAGSGLLVNMGAEKVWAIKIYDKTLSPKRLDTLIRNAKHQEKEFQQRGIVLAGKKSEKEAVVGAISGLLGEHAMSSLELTVPKYIVDKTLNQNLSQLPKFFFNDKGEVDEAMFNKLIAPQTIEDFVEGIHLSSKNSLFYSLVDLGVYVSNFELSLQYNIDYAEKKYSIISLPLQKFIAQSKEKGVSEDQLQAFYKKSKNNEEFKTAEKRSGTVWSFDESSYGIKVTKDEISKYYQENKQKYLVSPAEVQVRSLLIKVEPGEEEEAKSKIESLKKEAEKNLDAFADLVKKFSENEETASRGGLTDFFSEDTDKYDKVMVKAAFESLSKDGQISTPIKTEAGYELLQRVKRKAAKYKDRSSVDKEIEQTLKTNKFKNRFSKDAGRAISQTRYNPEVFNEFLAKHKGEKKGIQLEVRKNNLESKHLFETAEHKYVTFFDKDDAFIIKCDVVEKSEVPALQDVRNKVLVRYHEKQGKDSLEKALKEALYSARTKDMKEVAESYGATVQKASFEYKDGKVEKSPILRSSQVQSKLKSLHHSGALVDVITDHDGLLVRLDNIAQRDDESFGERKKDLSDMVFYSKKYQVKEGFIASLYRRAKLDNVIEMKSEVSLFIKEA